MAINLTQLVQGGSSFQGRTAEERQALANEGSRRQQLGLPSFGGEAQQDFFTRREAEARQRGLVDQANAFFGPQRRQEIDQTLMAQLAQALGGIQQQARLGERNSRFAAAQTGNVGGSTSAENLARVRAAAQQQALQAQNQAQSSRSQALAQDEQRRQSLISQILSAAPEDQLRRQQLLQNVGAATANQGAIFGLQNQARQQQQFANDELSRAIGGGLTGVANVVTQQAGTGQPFFGGQQQQPAQRQPGGINLPLGFFGNLQGGR